MPPITKGLARRAKRRLRMTSGPTVVHHMPVEPDPIYGPPPVPPPMPMRRPGLTDYDPHILQAALTKAGHAVGMGDGLPYDAESAIRGVAHHPMHQGVHWGGQYFTDPMDLLHWEQGHGNRTTFQEFYNHHPGLQKLFDMEIMAPGASAHATAAGAVHRAARVRQPHPGDPLRAAILRRIRGY